MIDRREMMVVHMLDVGSERRSQRLAYLQSRGFRVLAHETEDALLDGLGDDPRRGCVVAELYDLPKAAVRLLDQLRAFEFYLPVVITDHDLSAAAAIRSFKAGAADILIEPFTMSDLGEAVDTAFRLASLDDHGQATTAHVSTKLSSLTDREQDVLDGILRGLRTKEIGRELDISPRTVEVHRGRLMVKMEANNLAHLFRMIFSHQGRHSVR